MKLYSNYEKFKLYEGSMLDMLEVIAPDSIDAIVTDPPYELNFMGKGWDNSGIAFNQDTWKKCFEVIKSGGYLLAFGGSRTYHRIACAIEDAGFEIRDCIMWLYGSGFPKSMNIGLAIDKKNGVESKVVGTKKEHDIRNNNYANNDVSTRTFEREIKQADNEWAGWGTALKPAYEPIIVARKPFKGSCVDNVIKYGVGGINIDGCRIGNDVIKGGTTPDFRDVGEKQKEIMGIYKLSFGQVENAKRIELDDHIGRFPANVILDSEVGEDWRRYFYCAKASKKDRDEGLEQFETKSTGEIQGGRKEGSAGSIMQNADGGTRVNPYAGTGAPKKNTHPTVKPVDLMQYLIRLVTPPHGTVLDPFNGSGSTGKAAMYENRERNSGYKYIGIELTPEYLPIADARIKYAAGNPTPIEEPKEVILGQITLFDVLGGKNE